VPTPKENAEYTFRKPCGGLIPETEMQIAAKIGEIPEFKGCCMGHKVRYLADTMAIAVSMFLILVPRHERLREVDEAEAMAQELVKMAFNRLRLVAAPVDVKRPN